ncbi:MAG TPA: long-chain fatty acid--CoA ligase [Syntrophales bacterium]|nr:long-chain fatty acid--CoA ligase [Syntrophales bacterium]HOS77346.1 long-chain fatty acid--CoA ligase [Syntrophales bacterium]HQN24863.1 long-chain fatty acid--CoA ligase [Syntrophales bacterium]HQP27706.1 long-chain fatty acid--CoA ligase [Syntrophales bacterium]
MNPQVEPDNLLEFLESTVKKYPNEPAFGTKNASGVYEWVTYSRFAERVDRVRGGLAQLGVSRDDAVGIIANNRLEWAIAAYASYGLCARFVPMYENELPKTWEYIVSDSTVKVLFVSKPEILDKVGEFPRRIPTLKKLVLIEGEGPDSMAGLENVGKANPVASQMPKGDDIAGLIYTSGTTGDPKGVLLSHRNFTSNSIAGLKMYPEIKGPGDYSLSILPWAHSYGQTAELNAMIYKGGAIGFMENVTTIVNDMSLVRPTWLIAVPRVFNRIYDGLWKKMDEEGGIARKLFVMGVEAAKRKRELAAEGKTCLMTNLKFKLTDKIVFQKIREKMGGRLKGAMTGSAAMNVEIANFFFDVGIPTYDCYGMTETSPAIAMNASYAYRLGSVGRAIEKVRIEIDRSVVEETAKDGEIVVYGPNVMQGYHNKPEETRQVMTPDGGIRTGDRGRLDEDGYLYITGRIKEQFKLENGKFVFPAALEEDICLNPYVANALIYGENRPYTVCLVVPDFFSLEQYAEKHKLPVDMKALVEHKEIQDLIAQEITDMLKGEYGGYEIPKKYYLLAENFSLENGTLTQTMKVKRKVVLERYMDKIEALYR